MHYVLFVSPCANVLKKEYIHYICSVIIPSHLRKLLKKKPLKFLDRKPVFLEESKKFFFNSLYSRTKKKREKKKEYTHSIQTPTTTKKVLFLKKNETIKRRKKYIKYTKRNQIKSLASKEGFILVKRHQIIMFSLEITSSVFFHFFLFIFFIVIINLLGGK